MGRTNIQWYKHTPEQVVENTGAKCLWDSNVQCDRMVDRMVEARRPDIMFVDEQAKEAKIIDIAIPGDARVKDKEMEKINREALISLRRNRKVVEAEENDGCAN